jgi:DNA (cytosine-5)-methyltransferase 1
MELRSSEKDSMARIDGDPIAIDLFCGAGGLSIGLTDAGFSIIAALDNDPVAIQSYRDNIGPHVHFAAIEDVSASDLLSSAGIEPGECTLLAGGPPCQGFSLQRRGHRDDARNGLVRHFIRMVEDIQPQFFLMENVEGLLSKHGKPYLREFSLRASRLDYFLHLQLLNAADYGVPQRRRRAFLIGERTRDFAPKFKFPNATTPLKARTVRDAIGDLPSPPRDGSCHPHYQNHFREARLAAINIERIRHVPPGGGREHLPAHLQLDCHRNNLGHRHKDVYGRLAWDEPSVTLTARFDSFTRGRFAHPEEDRSLTIREGARIQTFPDSFVFAGNREDQARQVGNAVPPQLGERLGQAISAALVRSSAPVVSAIEDH